VPHAVVYSNSCIISKDICAIGEEKKFYFITAKKLNGRANKDILKRMHYDIKAIELILNMFEILAKEAIPL
jgi:hypothetical protein